LGDYPTLNSASQAKCRGSELSRGREISAHANGIDRTLLQCHPGCLKVGPILTCFCLGKFQWSDRGPVGPRLNEGEANVPETLTKFGFEVLGLE
jgi:hypothetical protein